MMTPNFLEIPNLEFLDLEGCIKLVQIDPSIGILSRLSALNLKDCKNLVSIPNNIFGLSSLKCLNISGCPKLLNNQLLQRQRQIEFPSTSFIDKVLKLSFRYSIFQKPDDHSVCLLVPLWSHMSCLKYLDLSFCNLVQIPNAIGWLNCLETLNLGGNNFVTLPSSIKELFKLRELNLEHCKQLKYLPELPSKTVLPVRETFFVKGGLYIFDCPSLIETECCYRMAFSWMIQLLKVPTPFFFPFFYTSSYMIELIHN
jgi:Leucine-rich repeat (LRR) protein